jgi:hypothetical protein
MEKLRNIGQLSRQHYEKFLLSIALLLLAAAVIYLFGESKRQADIIRQIPVGYEKRPVRAVPPVDLSGSLAALKQTEKPGALDFSGPHNLFNPVKWQINKGSTIPIKVVSGEEVGPRAMRIVKIQPVHLIVAYGQTSTSTVGDQLVVNGYWMHITNELAAVLRLRATRVFVSLNATNKDYPFILRDVKGGAQEPTEFTAEFKDGGEKFSFAPGKPHLRTIGYETELKYPNSTNTTGMVRKGGSIDIDGQPHKIVDITPNEVVLSDDSNGKLYPVRKFVAP